MKYDTQLRARLELLEVETLTKKAALLGDQVRVARAALGLALNRPPDKGKWEHMADAMHVIHTVTGEVRYVQDEQQPDQRTRQRQAKLEELEADLRAALDVANGAVEEAFREQRAVETKCHRGKRKGGWSVTYGKILTNTQDLIATAAAAVGANASKTAARFGPRCMQACSTATASK